MATGTVAGVDLDRLLKLRLAVARFGEMDCAKWWNTQGVLGSRGEAVMQRGFPRTRRFAQARVVFAVARARSDEVFSAPRSVTLWSLPLELEDQFEDRWQHWLDDAASWGDFFDSISDPPTADLLTFLVSLGLIDSAQADRARTLHRSHEDRAVQLGALHSIDDDALAMLAAAFACGETGKPAIPFAPLESVE